jgi:hypothetical protein
MRHHLHGVFAVKHPLKIQLAGELEHLGRVSFEDGAGDAPAGVVV